MVPEREFGSSDGRSWWAHFAVGLVEYLRHREIFSMEWDYLMGCYCSLSDDFLMDEKKLHDVASNRLIRVQPCSSCQSTLDSPNIALLVPFILVFTYLSILLGCLNFLCLAKISQFHSVSVLWVGDKCSIPILGYFPLPDPLQAVGWTMWWGAVDKWISSKIDK